jgi:hypothetical protein
MCPILAADSKAVQKPRKGPNENEKKIRVLSTNPATIQHCTPAFLGVQPDHWLTGTAAGSAKATVTISRIGKIRSKWRIVNLIFGPFGPRCKGHLVAEILQCHRIKIQTTFL